MRVEEATGGAAGPLQGHLVLKQAKPDSGAPRV
jgi:hypothetical protein